MCVSIHRQRRPAPQGCGDRGNREGFSLIELLVVMAMLAVLVAILIPAVTSARAGARRVQCAGNLRNISLALCEFEGAHGRLPAAGNFFDDDGQIIAHHNWAVSILPWVDQAPLYDRWDLDRPLIDPVNYSLTHVHIPLYVCPMDISRSSDRSRGDLSYVVNGGVGYTVRWMGAPDCPIDPEGTVLDLNGNGITCGANPDDDGDPSDRELFKFMGLFFLENWQRGETVRHYALADVRDGLSHTCMVSENVRVGYDPRNPQASYASSQPSRCAFFIGNPCPGGSCSAGNVDYSFSNQGAYRINSGLSSREGGSPVPNSFHAGGVHMAFADGHCRFLSESVEGGVYAALVSPQGSFLDGTTLEQPILSGDSF